MNYIEQRTNTFAIVSLVTGVLGVSVLAIIFGHIARSQIRRTGENGNGLALAGLIIGYVSLIATIAFAAYFIPQLIAAVCETLRDQFPGI